MTIKSVTEMSLILPFLTKIMTKAIKSVRRGKTLRLYLPDTVLQPKTPLSEAINELVDLGFGLKIYAGSHIFTPAEERGVWVARNTPRHRDHIVVEVAL